MLLCAKLCEYIIALFKKKSKEKIEKRTNFVILHKTQSKISLQNIKAVHIREQLWVQILWIALRNRLCIGR